MTSRCWKRGRSKILLAPASPGLGGAAEVAKRLTLWEECHFEDHFRRAEEQLLIHRKAGKSKQRDTQPDPLARADRPPSGVSQGHHGPRLVDALFRGGGPHVGQGASSHILPGEAGLQRSGAGALPSLGSVLRWPALARNTSRTCSVCLGESTPTSSTRRCPPCSA